MSIMNAAKDLHSLDLICRDTSWKMQLDIADDLKYRKIELRIWYCIHIHVFWFNFHMQLKCCTQQNNYDIPDLAKDYCNLQHWLVNVRMCTLFSYMCFLCLFRILHVRQSWCYCTLHSVSGIYPWDKKPVHEQRWKVYIFFFFFFFTFFPIF
jgi:hypothetical protein